MQAVHVTYQILDLQWKNLFFRSPISENAQNILDVSTGNGEWCRDVAEKFPSIIVHGVDLYPPPDTWVLPNCRFEVDDVLKTWGYQQKFDLIHLRLLLGAFEENQWTVVYKQAYQNLVSGGWIEQVEVGPGHYSDDASLPLDSTLGKWGDLFRASCAVSGKPRRYSRHYEGVEAAGFRNLQEKVHKVPCGEWAKHPLLKEAGKFNKVQFKEGLEGFAMHILTRFGVPQAWSPAEVQVLLAKARTDLKSGYHSYQVHKRIWVQKPFDAEPAAKKAEVELVDAAQRA